MPEHGHFQPLRALIADLVLAGCAVHDFTSGVYAREVERLGARVIDLFARQPLEQVDDESRPFPCRYVTFAAAVAEEVLEELRRLRPTLVIYEAFAVVGRMAAGLLGLPTVNVMIGHNIHPARFLPALRVDPRVAIADRCHRAVELLRARYGLADASPFSYIDGLSPTLNLCPEPPAFLTAEDRRSFEPVAFYGCLPTSAAADEPRARARPARADAPRIYAGFGTIVFRYFADAALGVFEAIADCLAELPHARATISLGGATVAEQRLRALRRPNVTVVDYADQWSALGEADVFITHHGVNSTHEAIMRRVPMLSYPFFSDQPAMAERCQQLGIAMPLAPSLRGAVDAASIRSGLATLAGTRDTVMADLDRARSWELQVIAERPRVIRQILDLAAATQGV
jgi:UDP:flavonoid glycosyltransferase YjiC (YdhE family)